MPIEYENLSTDLQAQVFSAEERADRVSLRPGTKAHAVLYVPANVVNGDTVTIGADVFEVDIINTDSTATCSGIANVSDPVLLTLSGAPGLTIAAGDLVRCENEIMKVLRKLSSTTYVVARGRCGTTPASHSNATAIYQSDAAPASNIPVGLVTTLTPAVFGPALVDEFVNAATTGGERAASKVPTLSSTYTPYALNVGQEILFVATAAGADTRAVSDTFSASTDNVWGAATFAGGSDPDVLAAEIQVRVPTAAEELAGQLHAAFPFTVRAAIVSMSVTATGQKVSFTGDVLLGYSESTDVSLPSTIVTLRNVGPASTAYITGFATTNTITILAFE
jgi:hypothetical protein